MTIIEDPTPDTDHVRWGVYGDWLEENGHEASAERAHAIARGLERTGGRLVLRYQVRTPEGAWFVAACCEKEKPAKGRYPQGFVRELAKKYGVSRVVINNVTKRKSWKHL